MESRRPRLLVLAVCTLVSIALLVSAGYTQSIFGRQRGWDQFGRMALRLPTPETFDGSFHFCRVMYGSAGGRRGRSGWSTDYPGADVNLSIRLSELTKTRVSLDESGQPNHVVVQLTDDALFQCPFVLMSEVGSLWFSEAEAGQLRKYLLKGGFLWVDDFWGTPAWESWVREVSKVLPPAQYPILDVPRDHAMLHTLFEITRFPQIPSIQFWRGDGGTSERGADSAELHVRAITDERGRVMVLMTHNTDIADSWEREGEDPDYFYRFSPEGYAVAINVLLYAMTH